MLHNPAASTQYPVTKRAFGLAILVLSGLQLMVVLDGTVVILALPQLQERMGLSDAARSWIVISYALTFGGLMLLGGRIGDAFGRKKMLLVGVALFTLASLLCGLAVDEGTLIGARALQGAGAALAAPTAMALIATTFAPGPARNQAIAIYGSMVGVGSIGGLVIGGALTQFSWRWIFLINVPIGALIIVGALYRLRDTAHQRLTLDVRGAVLATLGVATFVFGVSEGPELGWGSWYVIGSLIAGAVLFVAFIFAERRVDNPLLPWSLFDNRDRVATFVAIFFAGAVLMVMTVYVAQFVQNVLGYSPLKSGVAFIPFTAGVGVGSAVSSKLVMRVAPRWLALLGAVILVAGLFFGSTIDSSVWYFPTLFVLMCAIGFGVGLVLVPLPLCLLVGVGPSEIGPLAAVGQVLQNLGGPIALSIIGAMATSRTLSLGGTSDKVKPKDMNVDQIAALSSGYTLALGGAAVCALIAGLVAMMIRFTPAQAAQAQAAQEAAERG